MKKLFLSLSFIVAATSAGYAEELPSLKGLGTVESEALSAIDDTFVRKLEKSGEYESAILEWQRVYHNTSNKHLRQQALWRVARLEEMLGNKEKAYHAYENYGAAFPKSTYIPEALYRMGMLAEAEQNGGSKDFRMRLEINFPDNTWRDALDYAYAWKQAQNGRYIPESDNEKITELRTRLQELQVKNTYTILGSTSFSMVPGLGHFFLKDWRTGLMAFVLNSLFFWALVHALRKRDWPYALVFGLVFGILYTGTFFSARSLAEREMMEERLNAMNSWQHLHPKEPQEIDLPKVSSPAEAPLSFYRNVIGTFDGSRAAGFPVNSYYSKLALEKHGPLIGTWMTVDRLLRDWREISTAKQRIFADDKWRYYDPLERNDFWLERG